MGNPKRLSELKLVSQKTYKTQIQPKMLLLKKQLDLRSEIWAKIPIEKKKKWITSGKDPIMNLAFQMGQYFKDNFPEFLEDY